MRYFFHIAYQGTHYRGWQRQPNTISVQEVLENALSKVLRQRIVCIGCGRTDAEVHARQYFFHIEVEEPWSLDLVFVLNKTLPNDIVVYDIIPASREQHAQWSAHQRTYDYFLHTHPNPFLAQNSTYWETGTVDLAAMQAAADILPKYSDFRAFCKTPNRHKSTICRVDHAQWFTSEDATQFRFTISASRFLRGMIRIIVAKMLEVGTGSLSVGAFEAELAARKDAVQVSFAPPQGLYLSQVVYPFLEVEARRGLPVPLERLLACH